MGSFFPQKVDAWSGTYSLANTGGASPRGKNCDTFTASGIASGTRITITLNKGTMSDPYLHLFRSDGTLVVSDDDSNGSLNSKIVTEWYSGYYIGASTYGSESTGRTYTLYVSHGSWSRGSSPCNVPPKSNQTITFNTPSAQTYAPNGTFSIGATASSNLAVSFSSSTTSVCTVSGSTVTMKGAGTCTLTASQSGNTSWNAAPSVTRSFAINKANQSITFGSLSNRTYSPTAFGVSASSSSGLAVSFSSLTTATCTVSGSNVTMVASGTCTVRASQAGNTNYNAAAVVDQSFAVSKANQTITFANPGSDTIRRYNSPFTTSGSSTSGLAVTFASRTTSTCTTSGTNGTTINLINTGTCTLRATQAGDARFNAAVEVDQSFTVDKALQTITFNAPATRTYGDANFTAAATASSGLAVAFESTTPSTCSVTGTSVSILGAGSCTLRASQAGNALFEAASSVDRDFTINKKTLTAPSAVVSPRVYNGSLTAGSVTVGALSGLVGNETLNVTASASDYASPNVTSKGLNFFAVNRTSATSSTGKGVPVTSSTPGLCLSSTATVINVDWGSGGPGGTCNVDDFSTYYEGALVSPVSGSVTFYASTDDGFYLTINDQPVIDSWTTQAPQTYNGQGSINLVAGQTYSLKVWHFDRSSGAVARLYWSYPGQSVQIVPNSALYRGASTTLSFTLADGSGGGRASNYQIAAMTSSGVITPRPLSITAVSTTRIATDDAPDFDVTADGLAPGESLQSMTYNFRPASSTGSYTTTQPNHNLVGAYTVLPSNAVLASSRPLSNYTVTYLSGTYTINTGAASKVLVPAFNTSTSRVSGAAFGTQPVVTIQDDKGNTITSGDASTAVVTATLTSGDDGELVGTTTATAVQGVARFTNLGIRGLTTESYGITFSASYSSGGESVEIAGIATQTATVTHGPAAALRVTRDAAGARSGIAFSTQPQVEVLDVKGNRVTTGSGSTASVTVSLGGSGATLSGTATRVASSGLVTFSGLTLSGPAQETGYDLVFASAGLTSATQEDLPLTAGNAARLTLLRPSEGTASGAQFTTAPQIAVLDAQGNRVEDVSTTVTATLMRVNNTGSLVNGATAITATAATTDGVATFSTLGITGLQNTSYAITYSATVNNVALTTARQDVTVTVGAPASLRIDTAAAGATSRVALTTQPTLTILDSGGNVVVAAGDQGTVTVTAKKTSDVSVSAAVSYTLESAETSSGIAEFAGLTLQGEATTYTLNYSFSNGTQTLTASGSIALAAGPAAKLVLERGSSTSVAAGSALATQPIVRITDADNNLVSSVSAPVTVELTGAGTLGGTSTVNAVGGRAVFSGLNIRGAVGDYSLNFTTSRTGIASVAQPASITVTHGTANKVAVINANEVAAGSAQSAKAFGVSPVVQVQDAWGNKVSTGVWSTATISTSSTTGSSRVGTTSANAIAGERTFDTLGLRGVAGTTYAVTYKATYSGTTLSTAGQHNAVVSPGDATKVGLLRSSAGNASGVAFSTQPQIQLLDVDNNRVATSGVVIRASLTSSVNGTLIADTTDAETTDGVATFSGLGITGRAGSAFTISYRDVNATLTATSQSLTLAAGTPTALQMVTSSSTSLSSGSTLATAPTVRVIDSYGNAVPTNTVTIAAELATGDGLKSSSDGSVIGTTTRTTSSGSATFTGLGIRGVIGSYKLKFTASNLTAVEQTSNVTVTHGPAAQLAVANSAALEDEANVAASGAAFTTQPIVEVQDVSGNTVTTGTGATATITVSTSTGSSLISSVTAQASGGIATFSGVGINGRKDATYSLTYRSTVDSTALTPTTHNVTASTGVAKKLSLTQPAVGTASSVEFTTPPQVRLLDSGNNVVASENVSVAVAITQVNSKGELFSTGTLTALTDANGVAEFLGLGIRGVAGQAYTVTYSSDGLTSVTQSIRVSPGVAASTTTSPSGTSTASGGTVNDITVNGEKWRVHSFTTVGTSQFVIPDGVSATQVEYLVVGGGGGGGDDGAGGGGAGQVRMGSVALSAGSHDVVVGAGGTASAAINARANNGGASQIGNAVTAIGGGGGGSKGSTGGSGGSGGGGGHSDYAGASATDANSAQGVYGNAGGRAGTNGGGGGGGAGQAGANGGINGGNGGNGIASSITGTSVTYGGGGGGGSYNNSGGAGGAGGGGAGGGGSSRNGASGAANTGGGGGASGEVTGTAGNGGSGIVIVRYRLTTAQSGVALDPQPTVRITDVDGNLVDTSSALVTVSMSRVGSVGDAGELIGTTQVRAVNGVATFTDLAILGTADVGYQLSFAIEGQEDPSTSVVTLEPGEPAALSLKNSPSTQISGSAETVALATAPQIQLLDSMGNVTVRENIPVNVAISAGGSLGGTTSANTNASGIATLNAFTVGARVGTYTLTFSSTGLQPVSHTVTAVVGTASKIVVDSSVDNIRAGSGTRFNIDGAIRVTDAAGNTVTNSTAAITATSRLASNNTVSGTLTNNGTGSGSTVTANAVGGVVPLSNFALAGTADTAYTITYTGTDLTSASHAVTLTAGVPAQVAVTSSVIAGSGTVVSGTNFGVQPKIAIRDSSSNLVVTADTSPGLKMYAKDFATTAGVQNIANRTEFTTGTCYAADIANIDFSFDGSALESACGVDTYMTFYTGYLVAPVTGNVTFHNSSDDGFYLLLDESVVINNWVDQGPSVFNGQGTTSLIAGRTYKFRAWHYENGGGSVARLYWSYNGQSSAVPIPASAFTSPQVTAAITSAPEGAVAGTPSTSGGTYALTGTTTANVVSGIATFTDLGITGPVGDYTITYTWGSITQDQVLTVAPGTPAAIIATAPESVQAGKRWTSPTVKVVDGAGNTVTTSTASITASLQGSPEEITLRGTTTRGAVNGVATFNDLSLNGTVGDYTLNFATTGLDAQTKEISVVAGDPARIEEVEVFNGTLSRKSGELLDVQPYVRLLDAYDNVVLTEPEIQVQLEQVEVDGVLTGTLTGADEDSTITKSMTASADTGVAQFSGLAINGVDGQRYRLSITASGVSPVIRSYTITTGDPVALRLERAGDEEPRVGIAMSQQPIVAIIDSGGNVVENGTSTNVTASIDAGATVSTDGNSNVKASASGLAEFSGLTLNGTASISGTAYTVTYSASDLTSVTQSVTLFPGAVTAISVNNIDTRESGDAFSDMPFETTPVVRTIDSSENTVAVTPAAVTATITNCSGPTTLECIDARLVGTTSHQLEGGQATFDDLGIRGKIGTYTVTYTTTINGAAFSTNHTVAVEGGDPARMSVDQSSLTAQVGAVINPVITFLDTAGNAATTDKAVTATITQIAIANENEATGLLNGGNTAVAANGVANFAGNELNVVGVAGQTYTLTYSAPDVPSVDQQVTLTPGVAATMNVDVQPAGASSGSAMLVQPRIRLLDVGGNNAAGAPGVSVEVVNAPAGTVAANALSGTTIVNTADGVAAFSGLSLAGKVGDYTLRFSSDGVTAQDVVVELAPGAPSALLVVRAPTAMDNPSPSGSPFGSLVDDEQRGAQPIIAVTDAQGNTITSAIGSITASITDGEGGSLVGTVSAFVENGLATFNDLGISGLAANNPYEFTFTHSATNLTVTQPVHVAAGPAAQLLLTAQVPAQGDVFASRFVGVMFDGQKEDVGTAPRVVVADSGGNTVTTSNASVTAAISNGATLIGEVTKSAVAGVVDFSDLGFVGTAGEQYTITYSTTDLASAAETITAETGPATQLGIARAGARAKTGAPLITQPQIQLLDAGRNPVAKPAVVVAVSASDDGVLSGVQTATTDETGRADFTNLSLLGLLGADYTLTYSATDVTAVSHEVRVELGDPYKLELFEAPSMANAGAIAGVQPVVLVKDFGGNLVSSATNNITTSITRTTNVADQTLNAGAVVGTNPATRAGISEYSNFGIVGTAGETYRVTFASDGLQAVTQDVVAQVGPATNITIDTDASAVVAPAGDPIATSINVSIRDAGGNIVDTDDNVSASISAGASLDGTVSVAAVNGIATFTDLRVVGTTGSTPTVTFSVLGVGTTNMAPTISTGSAAQLVPQITSRTSPSGATFDTVIDVRDAGGNLVSTGDASTATITASVTPVDINGVETGVLVAGVVTSGSASAGSRTFTLGLDGTVGVSYELTYSATVVTGDAERTLTGSEMVQVAEGAPVSIALTREAQGTASGVVFTTQPMITMYDSGGNITTGTNLRLRASVVGEDSTGRLDGSVVIPFVNGVAEFTDLGISGVADEVYDIAYAVIASDADDVVEGIVAIGEDVKATVGPAKNLEFVEQIGEVISGQAFGVQPTIRIVDSGGNTVTANVATVTATISDADDGSNTSPNPTGALVNGGSISKLSSVAVDAVDGIARFTSLGLRGIDTTNYTIRFAATLSGSSQTITQTITPIGGIPASLAMKHRDGVEPSYKQQIPSGATLAEQPVIHILDTEGNISVGSSARVVASITQVTATGELLGTTAVSAVQGVATFTDLGVTGTAGQDYVITYTVNGVPAQTETVTVQIGAPTQLRISEAASGAKAGLAFTTQPRIEILDSGNNLTESNAVVSAVVEQVTVGGQQTGVLVGTTSSTAVGGIAEFEDVGVGGIAGTSYTVTYSASVNDVALQVAAQSITPVAGTPVTAEIVRAANEAVIDEQFVTQPVIAVKDIYGNTVTNSTDVVTVSVSDGGTLTGQTARRAVNGRVDFSGLGLRGTVGRLYTLSYALAGYEARTHTIRLFSGAANRLSIVQVATGAPSGAAFDVAPQVAVKDAKGNLVFDSTMEISVSVRQIGGTGVLVGDRAVAAVDGVATFEDLGITGLAGSSYEITFEAVGMLPDSQSVSVTVGQPTSVDVLRPSIGTAAAEAFTQQPQIVLRDTGGNVVPTSDTTVTATVSDGTTLVGNTSATTDGGVATFADLGVSGPVDTQYTVTYSVDGVDDTETETGTLTIGSPRALALTRPAVGTTAGALFTTQPQVTVRDGAGNTVTASTAPITATIVGSGGGLTGGNTRNAVQGVATFVNLGLIGTPDESYTVIYSSPGLIGATQTFTATPAQTGVAATFSAPIGTVDGFRAEITNYDSAFTYTATATSGARVMITTSEEVGAVNDESVIRGYVLVSGLDGDQLSTVTVTSSRAEYTTVTSSVQGRSLKRPALNPLYGDITPTSDGFSVQITNYNPSYIWVVSLPTGARATIGVSGVMRVSGVPAGTSVSATVSTTRPGYEDGRSTTNSVTTLLAGRTPTFGAVTRTDDGFTVQITNYDPTWTWSTTATGAATASIDASGFMTVSSLVSGAESTVLVKTTRNGYSTGSASVTGRAISAARTPAFGTESATATGWTVPITNYDAAFTWSVVTTTGQATIVATSATTANLVVTNVADSETALITVSTTRTGFQPGSASTSLRRISGLLPEFGTPESDQNSVTLPIENYDSLFTWTVTSTGGSPSVVVSEGDGQTNVEVVVTGLQPETFVSVTVTTTRLGYTTLSNTYTYGTTDTNDSLDYLPEVLAPVLGDVTRTVDGFSFSITNFADYDDSYEFSVQTSDGEVVRVDDEVTVTSLNPGFDATVVVSVNASGQRTAVARKVGTAQQGAGLVPQLSAAASTQDGYVFTIDNFNDTFIFLAEVDSGTATISDDGVVTVTGLTPGASATTTITSGRSGYAEVEVTITARTTTGRALVPTFGLARATTDGFEIPISNYTDDEAVTWTVTTSEGTATRADGVITVTGLTAGQVAEITATTGHQFRSNGQASFTFAALGADGATPGVTRGLAPAFGAVTRTLDGFTVPITNFNNQYEWSTVSAAGASATVNNATGVLTVTGLDAGETDDVVVVTNRSGYGTGNARITASALSEGERERNLLTGVTVGPICSTGSPEGYEVGKVNDLSAVSTYACFVNDARNIGTYAANSIGFYSGDLSSVVVDRVTFTSSSSAPEHDPYTYSLWGCAEENRFCSAIVSNDITNLSTTRGSDSVRTIRNTRAFRYYRLVFTSVRGPNDVPNGPTHTVNIGEVSFGGRSAEQAALTPTLGTATVSSSGVQIQVNNYSSLYSWNVSVPAPGIANISTSGLITISNLAPDSASSFTVTASRSGYATGTTSYSFTTTAGPELRPVLSRPVLTADGARVRIENFNTNDYAWVASVGDCSTLQVGDPTVPITANGLMIITGYEPEELVTLSVCTSRPNYQDGKSEVTFTVPSAGLVAQFDTPTRTDDGFDVQIVGFDAEYSWSVRASNGATVLLENNGLVRVSNLGAGQSSTVTVTTSRSGYSNGVAQVTSSAIDAALVPEFSDNNNTDTGYEFTIANYNSEFAWTAIENNGATVSISETGVVSVTTANPSASFVTVTTTRANYQTGTASLGAALNLALVPVLDEETVAVTETSATVEITNYDPAYTWSASVIPAGRVLINQATGVISVTGASPGADLTIVVNTARTGYVNGRTSLVVRTVEREGLAPALAAPIRLVGGFSVDITNFDPRYVWSATTTAGTAAVEGDNVLVTNLSPAQSATVTVTASRVGYSSRSTDVVSSALLSPAVVPQFGAPTSTLGGFTTQITNYDAALTWTASVSAGGTATISSTGLVTVTGLPGLTTAELVVGTESPTHVTGRAATTGTSLVNPALTPQFGLTESTPDGIRVRIRNYDPRWTWTPTVSGADGSNVSVGQDGLVTVSGVTGVRYITLTVKSERAGFISGAADVSAYSLPEPRITLGAQSVTQYEVTGVDADPDRQAVLTTTTAHGFRVGDVIVVTGVSPELDGERTISAVTTTAPHTMSFATSVATTAVAELIPTGSVRLLDDINLEVLMTDNLAPIVVRAQINIPFSTADSGTEFTATTMMSEVIDAGYRVVRIRAESETEGRISELNVPIRILFDPPAEGAVPVYSGDGGETWRILDLLDTPFLPDDREDGYFVSADGRVWVFTRHLSIFGLLARQAVPITVSSTANSMFVGDVASTSISGGEGEGELSSRVLTPDVCSLSENGDVTALRAGECVIEGKRAAFDRFVEATGTLTISISDRPVEAPVLVDEPTTAVDVVDVVAEAPKKKTKKSTTGTTGSGTGVGEDSSLEDDATDGDDVDDSASIDDGQDDIDKGVIDDGDSDGGRNFSLRWVVFGALGLLILLGVLGLSLRFRRRTL